MSNSQPSIIFLLANAVKALAKKTEADFLAAEVPINIHHHYLLNIIDSHNEMIQAELATLMERDKSAVLRHIDQLEEMGFVEREPDKHDRRRKILVVTKTGKALLKQTRVIVNHTMNDMLEGLSEEDITTFRRILIHLQKNELS